MAYRVNMRHFLKFRQTWPGGFGDIVIFRF